MPSPFLTPGSQSELEQLALLHLRRDQTIPTILQLHDEENPGYEEGNVTNTRFGSFPHSTLFNRPWGSQISASKVDTGSRGRALSARQLKRKANELDSPTPGEEDDSNTNKNNKTAGKLMPKKAVAASSGFLHILYPTPELWTASLPHRTQVVYTPDYSYILHRLGVRPGSVLIEAGAGSGSFTHAAARAVFNGYPSPDANSSTTSSAPKRRRVGKVCSFEFHAQRAEKIRAEVHQHGLDGLVQVTHRDVYQDGFLLGDPSTGTPPKANAVFLDLPAPWLALKHLVRNPASGRESSPLDPSLPVHICTFSPCIEQVQRTISALRQLSWLSISMVEVQHHRVEVKREKSGLEFEGVRGATVFPQTVEDAVAKTRVVEERSKRFRESLDQEEQDAETANLPRPDTTHEKKQPGQEEQEQEQEQDQDQDQDQDLDLSSFVPVVPSDLPSYAQGRLVHRSEPDLKTHTSYLVFAVLPREWTEEDERRCQEKWPSQTVFDQIPNKAKSKKQLKREAKAQQQQQQQQDESSAP